jgi:hypothetical protein
MSYDGGSHYDPETAFQAYRLIYNGDLVLGMEISPEGALGDDLTLSEVSAWSTSRLR